MPGLSIAFSREGFAAEHISRLAHAKSILTHDSRYSIRELYSSAHLQVIFSAYQEYPFQEILCGRFLCFVEGMVYSQSSESLCKRLCELIGSGDEVCKNGIESVLGDCDGEFAIVVLDESGERLHLFVDALGQLPMFLLDQGSCVYFSREQKFITCVSHCHEPDRLGIAQYLMYGFNFGNRTLSRDLVRCEQAFYAVLDLSSGSLTKSVYHEWNLQSHRDSPGMMSRVADEVTSQYLRAVETRVKGLGKLRPVISLSGGLDSRVVLSGMMKYHGDVAACTVYDKDRPNAHDFNLAKELAAKLSAPIMPFEQSRPNWSDVEKLIRLHEGASPAFMATAVQSLDRLIAEYGTQIALATGGGGNTTMYPLLSPVKGRTLEEVLNKSLRIAHYVDLETAARIVGSSSDEVWGSIYQSINSYPEPDPRWKHAHYRAFGRSYRFVIDGEDRNRFWCWTVTPLWGLGLFKFMLSLPDSSKRHFHLYCEFMRRLDPRLMLVPYAAIKVRLGISSLPLYSRFIGFVHGHDQVYRALRALLVHREQPRYRLAPVDTRIREILKSDSTLKESIDTKLVLHLIEKGQPRLNYYLLVSIILRLLMTQSDYQSPNGEPVARF